MCSIEWWYFQWPWRTPNLALKVKAFLKSDKNTNRKPYWVYRMASHSMTFSDLWPGFQGHDIFWSQISEKQRVLETKLVLQEETIPNIWNGTMFGDLEWPLNTSCRFVSISWACFNSQWRFCLFQPNSFNNYFVVYPLNRYIFTHGTLCVSMVFAVIRYLDVCPSHACIVSKPNLKLFRPSGNPSF